MSPEPDEADRVRERYARRTEADWRYHRLNPAALLPAQERERALAALLREHGITRPQDRRVLEVGCGAGGNLAELQRFGFEAAHLTGIELLAARCRQARSALPAAVSILEGDATVIGLPPAGFDLVLQSTVFSSLLDPNYQTRLAAVMWRALKPGGAVLWYDFTVDNPRNADVRGVPLRRVRALFPEGRLTARRTTLAPPLARAAVAVHPALYTALNALPWLRTHLLCRIDKGSITDAATPQHPPR